MEKLGLHLALAFLAANTACSDSEVSQPKIYGGNTTNSWRSVAAIMSDGNLICTATVVAERLLVTAAHCLVDRNNLTIRIGYSIKSDAIFEVESYRVSPKYKLNKSEWNDVGYLVTVHPMILPEFELPEVSSYENDQVFLNIGQLFTIVGFGQNESGESGHKREAQVKLTKVEQNEIELGGEGIDSCLGDSGGPAFFVTENKHIFLVGVVSRGKKCGQGGRVGRLREHACWIQSSSGIKIQGLECE
jgi:secreted trypsin-like serine protease